MQNRYVNGWYVTCWYCKNTVDANRVKCPYVKLGFSSRRKTMKN